MDGAGIERVWRPVEDQESCAGDDAVAVSGEPRDVFLLIDHLRDPGLEVAGHDAENLVVGASRVDEHAPAVMRDDVRVGCCGSSSFQHGAQYS